MEDKRETSKQQLFSIMKHLELIYNSCISNAEISSIYIDGDQLCLPSYNKRSQNEILMTPHGIRIDISLKF